MITYGHFSVITEARCKKEYTMTEFAIGVLLCWLGYYTGDKVRRGTSLMIPGKRIAVQFIAVAANICVLGLASGWIYSFWVFQWWYPPIVLIGSALLTGWLYVKLEQVIGFAILSVPLLGIVGAAALFDSLL